MITVTLVGAQDPKEAQIVVDSVASGVAWHLTGTAGDWEWTVPGGEGVGDGGQLVLLDNRAPGNQPVTYRIDRGGIVEESDPLTIPMTAGMVLQSADGSRVVPVGFLKGSGDTTRESNQAQFRVSGRRRPVVRYDVTGDIEGEFKLLVDMPDSREFEELISDGEPLVYRMGQPAADLPPVGLFAYGDLSSEARPRLKNGAGVRIWTVPYTLVDDPILDVRLGSAPWDEIDAVMSGLTWDQVDARFAGLSWDEMDRFDWSTA